MRPCPGASGSSPTGIERAVRYATAALATWRNIPACSTRRTHMPPPADRYRVNDALGALASEFGVDLDDTTLNELPHTVADVLDRAADPANRPAAPATDPDQALA